MLQYAIEYLKIEDVVVCGHYDCGGVAAACAENLGDGYVADWLMITSWAKSYIDGQLAREGTTLSRAEYLRRVVEENVRHQVKHLSHLTIVRKSWKHTPGIPRIHGWVYDLGTGIIKVLSATHGDPPRHLLKPRPCRCALRSVQAQYGRPYDPGDERDAGAFAFSATGATVRIGGRLAGREVLRSWSPPRLVEVGAVADQPPRILDRPFHPENRARTHL